MSNTKKHAERELSILAKTVKNALVTPFSKEIIALADKFGESGQSGGSAPMTAKAISQAVESVLLQKPICDITGINDEWMDRARESGGNPVYQNNRLSSVFKEGKDGRAYYLDAIVFKGDIGGTFTGNSINLKGGRTISSRQFIKEFPFTPKTFFIDVIDTRWADKEEKVKDVNGDWWTHEIKDESQLEAVAEYYDLTL